MEPGAIVPTPETKLLLRRSNTDVTRHELETNARTFVFEVTVAYQELALAHESLDVSRTAFKNAHKLWEDIKSRYEAGIEGGEAANEAQARAQYFTLRARLQHSRSELLYKESRLRYLTGISSRDGRIIVPSLDEPSFLDDSELDWHDTLEQTLESHPRLQQQRHVLRKMESELKAAREQTRSLNAVGENAYSKVGAAVDADGVKTEQDAERFGIDFQMPLGTRRELAHVGSLELQVRRAERQLRDMELEVTHKLSAAVRRVNDAMKVMETRFNSMRAYRDQVLSLPSTRAVPLDVVLDAHSRQTQAELDFHFARNDYHKAIAEVNRIRGHSLPELGIAIEDAEVEPR